jgi:hypothetical protein
MKTTHKTGLSENIRITVFYPNGTKESINLRNEIKTCWLNAIRDALKGVVTDLEIKYIAWGSSNAANSTSQTTLGAEFGRKQITSQTNGGDGELDTVVYVAPAEATEYTIEELGWFAGESATSSPNSGILVARVLYNRAKTNLESLQIERTDSISEVT